MSVNETPGRRKTMDHKSALILTSCGIMLVFVASQLSMSTANNDAIFNKLKSQRMAMPSVTEDSSHSSKRKDCRCRVPTNWTSQAGQDAYLFHRVFFHQELCCRGVFVEFGARNGIDESNTYRFEHDMGWTGLMFEVDPREQVDLKRNRPGAEILMGPVCPSYMSNVTIALSNLGGWTGAGSSMEPTRKDQTREQKNFKCFHLATELRKRNMTHIDYMTIDTEGSELDIIRDFPWNDFDIRVVQIEQLIGYVAQHGKKDSIVEHMTTKFGYKHLGSFEVAKDTHDLIFTRNIDQYLELTDFMRGKNPKMFDTDRVIFSPDIDKFLGLN